MNQPSIEEQLKAIESAINLTESRNLPAVVESAKAVRTDADYEGREAAKAREAAFIILKKIDEKISDLESSAQAQMQQHSQTQVVQNEQQEALELISKEVATLKKRAQVMEQGLRHIQFKPVMDKFNKAQGEWSNRYIMWLIGFIIIAIIFLVWNISSG